MDFESDFAAVTYLEDGFSASIEVRELRKHDKTFYQSKEELEEDIKDGVVVLAYWYEHRKYYEAVVHYLSASEITISAGDSKKWKSEASKLQKSQSKVGEARFQESTALLKQINSTLTQPLSLNSRPPSPSSSHVPQYRHHRSRSRSRSRSPSRSRSRSPSKSRRHYPSRSRSHSHSHRRPRSHSPSETHRPRPSSQSSEPLILTQFSEFSKRLVALEQKLKQSSNENGDSEFFTLSDSHPEFKVSRDKLKDKMASKTPSGKIKGVYDLLLSRDQQAKYSGKGRGKFPAAPIELKEALRVFFQKRLGYDPETLITEAINEKGAQARSDLKQKAGKAQPEANLVS